MLLFLLDFIYIAEGIVTTVKEYLQKIDKVIAESVYKDNWESLSRYPVPEWYKKAKFGAFIHWGAYSVPSYMNEWYPRFMYYKMHPIHWHHVKTYGKDFQYRNFIEQFTAPRFDPKEWISLFKEAGFKYVMPVGEHHDGFKMYDSDLSRWTTVKQAMGRDVLGELRAECLKQGVEFATSSHRAEHFWFMNGGSTLGYPNEVTDPEYKDLYGPAFNLYQSNDVRAMAKSEHGITPTDAWMEDWLASSAELIDKYRPSTLFFDWWISHHAFRPYVKRFLAYYYNRSLEWGQEVCVQYKADAIMYNASIFDCERGQLPGVSPYIWQCETATAKNSWCYCTTNHYKSPEEIARMFCDVISKNGNFVLNVGPKPDGTICEEDVHILKELGKWTTKNAEAIWGTSPYKVFGEGNIDKGGSFKDNPKYTKKDFRYTFKAGHVYAFAMMQDKKGVYKLKSLRDGRDTFHCIIKGIKLLGYDIEVKYELNEDNLTLKLGSSVDTAMPLCFDIEVD